MGQICRFSGLFATPSIFWVRRRTGGIRLGSESKDRPKPLKAKAISQRSLSHLEVAYEEESFLRKGLAALDAVYTEIDFASIALSKQRPH